MARETCPGCNGTGTRTTQNPCVSTCERCGGLFTTVTISWQECLAFVNLNQMQDDAPEGQLQYFDFVYAGPTCDGGKPFRTHGWFDRGTRKVVQFG